MKKNEYMAKVLPDGHLSLPPTLASQLGLKVNSEIRVLILSDTEKKGLNRFCGKWQDEQSAEDQDSEVFGIWKNRATDGVKYQEKLRREWHR